MAALFRGERPGKFGEAFGIGGAPFVLLVDRKGRLRFFGANYDHVTLEQLIEELLAENSVEKLEKTITAYFIPNI